MAEQSKSLLKKLHAVMAALDRIEKRGQNRSQGYDYLMAEDVLNEVRKKFIEQGLVVLPSCVEQESVEGQTQSGGTNYLTRAKLEYTICDVDTGESFTLPWEGLGQDSGDKGLYKAYTGAIKYFLRNLLLIPTEDDPENDGTPPKPVRRTDATDTASADAKQETHSQNLCTDKQLDLIFAERKRRKEGWKPILDFVVQKGFDLKPCRGMNSAQLEEVLRPWMAQNVTVQEASELITTLKNLPFRSQQKAQASDGG